MALDQLNARLNFWVFNCVCVFFFFCLLLQIPLPLLPQLRVTCLHGSNPSQQQALLPSPLLLWETPPWCPLLLEFSPHCPLVPLLLPLHHHQAQQAWCMHPLHLHHPWTPTLLPWWESQECLHLGCHLPHLPHHPKIKYPHINHILKAGGQHDLVLLDC